MHTCRPPAECPPLRRALAHCKRPRCRSSRSRRIAGRSASATIASARSSARRSRSPASRPRSRTTRISSISQVPITRCAGSRSSRSCASSSDAPSLGLTYLVSHPGNYMDDRESGIARNAEAITESLARAPGDDGALPRDHSGLRHIARRNVRGAGETSSSVCPSRIVRAWACAWTPATSIRRATTS